MNYYAIIYTCGEIVEEEKFKTEKEAQEWWNSKQYGDECILYKGEKEVLPCGALEKKEDENVKRVKKSNKYN